MKRLLPLSLLFGAPAAWAHHPLAGMPMETFTQGLLSGIGHPVLGFNHLFFVVLVGIAAACHRRAHITIGAYTLAVLAACGVVSLGASLPAVEFLVALSLLLGGLLVLRGRELSTGIRVGLFGLAGLFHGAAFAGAMTGVETAAFTPVMAGYLLGLGAIQYGLGWLAGELLRRVRHGARAGALAPRLAGAMVAGAGLFLVLEGIESYGLSAMGI